MDHDRLIAVLPENETWTPTTILGGASHRDIPCHVAVGVRGENIVAWARVHFAGMQHPITLTAQANLADIEKALGRELNLEELNDEVEARADAVALGMDAEILGRRSRRRAKRQRRRARIKAKLKHVAKKIGKSKVIRGIAKVAKKVINNPLVKGMLAVVPGGQAVLATQAAAKLAARAIKGGKKAKRAVKAIHSSYKRGNPKAKRMMGLVRQGLKARLRAGGKFGRISGDDLERLTEGQAFALIAGECLSGQIYAGGCVGLGADVDGADPNDDQAAGLEADALATVSDGSAQWEPMRWAILRMGPGFDPGNPTVTARDALMEGRAAQSSRYKKAGPGEPWDVRSPTGERLRMTA